jgi:phosphonate transport system ATP-binding protein
MVLAALAPVAAAAPVDRHGAADRAIELAARGLRKTYDGGARVVLDGVDLAVRRHEVVAFMGANGSGKSTLLRCCVRLVEPDAGEITLFGDPISTLKGRALRRARGQVGFVFQRHNLVPRASVLANVVNGGIGRSMACCFQATAPGAARERAFACLERVGLAHLAGRRADRLSGGESQRVAIARALMPGARLILADEPVASLDPHVGEEIMALLIDVARLDSATVLFSCHVIDHALRLADRILGLRGGSIVLDAPARDVSRRDLQALYG